MKNHGLQLTKHNNMHNKNHGLQLESEYSEILVVAVETQYTNNQQIHQWAEPQAQPHTQVNQSNRH